jgi:hypothetical protein
LAPFAPQPTTPEEAARKVAADIDKWRRIVPERRRDAR